MQLKSISRELALLLLGQIKKKDINTINIESLLSKAIESLTDPSGTSVYQPVVGFGAVGIKTLNKGLSGSVCRDGPTIPVTKPTLNKPSRGYSTKTTLRNLLELSLRKVSKSCLRVL